MTMSANFFAKIEQVRFFPKPAIYKINQAHPPRGRDPFHCQQVYLLYQPIGDTPWNPAKRKKTHPILPIVLLNNK